MNEPSHLDITRSGPCEKRVDQGPSMNKDLFSNKEEDMEKPFVRYRREKRYFETPPDWKVLTFAAFHDHPRERDVGSSPGMP